MAVSHCEFRRREKENKRCDRAEGSAAILPTIAELLRFRLVALTRLHQLSSHVYSSSVAAFKALFVLRTKDQLDTLCRFPLLSPLHYMPHQFLIDRSSSIFHVMPGRNKRLSTGKKGKIPLLFFLIVNVVVNEKKKKKIKGTTLEMYSPLNFFLRWRQEHRGLLLYDPDIPAFSLCLLITNGDTLGGWLCELDIVLYLIEGRLISTFLPSSLWRSEHSDNSTGIKNLRCGAMLGTRGWNV